MRDTRMASFAAALAGQGRAVAAAAVVLSLAAATSGAAPIPRDRDARTERDFLNLKLAWLLRNALGPRPWGGGAPARSDREARFIQDSCRFACRDPRAPRRAELAANGASLVDAGSRDPVVLACYGIALHLNHRVEESVPLLRRAVAGLDAGVFPDAWGFLAGECLANALYATDFRARPEALRIGDAALSSLAGAIRSGEFRSEETQIAYRLLRDARRPFDIERWRKLHEAVAGEEGVHEWLATAIAGKAALERMWKTRGGSSPRRLSNTERREFNAQVAEARRLLTRSLELDRSRPEPAALMITLAMADANRKEGEIRAWFDRAAAAQVDYGPAYRRYIISRQPGWYGSDEAMRDFGLECIESGRFDTIVPAWYLYAMKLMVYTKPYQSPDRRMPHMSEGIRENVRRIFDGMLADPAWSADRDRLLTQYALYAAWYGDHRKAADALGEVEGAVDLTDDPWGHEFRWDARRRAVIEAEILAYTGPAAEVLARADSARSGREAWPLFRDALAAHGDDERVRRYLTERMVHARLGHRPSELRIDRTALHHAAEDGDVRETRFLLEEGFELDPGDSRGRTPLMLAGFRGHTEVVALLLERGADVHADDSYGETPLHHALKGGRTDAARFMLSAGAEAGRENGKGWNSLHFAAKHAGVEGVRLVLELGVPPDVKNDSAWTPLHLAAERGDAESAALLVGKGASLEARTDHESTPLLVAMGSGRTGAARRLLELGADPDAQADDGWAAVHFAARRGDAECVALLLRRGAAVELATGARWTPLHHAAKNESPEVARLLLDAGARIEARQKYGWTPLHLAAKNGGARVVALLLERGADVFALASGDRTPLDMAAEREKDRDAVIEMIRRRTEKPETSEDDEGEQVF